jgi:hypothetical protein
MKDLLKGNFPAARKVLADEERQDERAQFRKRALESISGSMVFVEDRLIYWDILDE